MEQQMSDTQDRILTSQTEIDELHKVLDDAQSQQEERLLESVVDMTEQLKEQETTRDEALARLAEWQAQAQAQAEMIRQLEEMEVAYRDEMETLRDTLQNENDQLETSLNDMAKKVDELEESSGALREEIQVRTSERKQTG
jgi:chromosome segregation ATPase